MAGLCLDPWQEYAVTNALAEREDGRWAAFEVGIVVSRQNGKGGILEARELAGLFLLGERLIIHSAHQFDTSLEAFRRLLALIEDTPDLDRRVRRVSRSHGEEGIELKSGQRIRFRTRTSGGGRGFTADCVIFDEAMILQEAMVGAVLPTLSARPNPQVWYTGSAVDQEINDHGIVLARVRERGSTGEDPSLAYFEWSCSTPIDQITPTVAVDPEAWAQANPAMGIRITAEYISRELPALGLRTFAVERLGAGDWPRTDADADRVIDPQLWADCEDAESTVIDPVAFSFDVTPDRSYAAIAVAGKRSDGLSHVEIIQHQRGTGWVVDRMAELVREHRSLGVVLDAGGPAGSLLSDLESRRVKVIPVNPKEHGQACGMLFDSVQQRTLRHLGTPELTAAIDGGVKRPLGDAWAWSRKNSGIDISPLVACTLAHWGAQTQGRSSGATRVISMAQVIAEMEAEEAE